jgi:hypothetical protein
MSARKAIGTVDSEDVEATAANPSKAVGAGFHDGRGALPNRCTSRRWEIRLRQHTERSANCIAWTLAFEAIAGDSN